MRLPLFFFLTAQIFTLQSLSQSLDAVNCAEVVLHEDFSNAFQGSSTLGPWEVEASVSGIGPEDIWLWVDAEGIGHYENGVATGVEHPGGYYSTTALPLRSSSAENGWAIFDSDFFHGGEINSDNPALAVEGTLTSMPFDCSSFTSVVVTWESNYRFCCSEASPIFLEVGTLENNVWTWESFDASDNFTEGSNVVSLNPKTSLVNVSCAAANVQNVKLRFAWRQLNEGTNSHYFWGIDDVEVRLGNAESDIQLLDFRTANGTYHHHSLPLHQFRPWDNGGMSIEVDVANNSLEAGHDNLAVLVEIFGEDDNLIFQSAPETTSPFWQPLACEEYLPYERSVSTGWEHFSPEELEFRVTLSRPGIEDGCDANNVLTKPFEATLGTWRHQDPNNLDPWMMVSSESSDFTDAYEPVAMGQLFGNLNGAEDIFVDGLLVRFSSRSGLGTDGNPAPLSFHTALFDAYPLEGTQLSEALVSKEWTFHELWRPDSLATLEVYLPFDEPFPFGTYPKLAAVVLDEPSSGRLALDVHQNTDSDNSSRMWRFPDPVWFETYHDFAIGLVTQGDVPGCHDELACNFMEGLGLAEPCEYESCSGCTDDSACNYNDLAQVDSGNCDYSCLGCTDPLATNYDAESTLDDGSCTYFIANCDFLGALEWSDFAYGLHQEDSMVHMQGQLVTGGQVVLVIPEGIVDVDSGSELPVDSFQVGEVYGMPAGLTFDMTETLFEGGQQVCLTYSGTPLDVGTFEVGVSGTAYTTVFGMPLVVQLTGMTVSMVILPNPDVTLGCTYPLASNFDPEASVEDGSCQFDGCTNESAWNFQKFATTDDGSCEFDCNSCPSDFDNDGITASSDLLLFLTNYGILCD